MVQFLFMLIAGVCLGAEVKTGEVTQGEVRVDVELSGLFVGSVESPVAVKPEGWKDWTIRSVVAHGSTVAAGDVLLDVDTRKIDISIAEWDLHVGSLETALQRSRDNFEQLKQLQPTSLAEVELKQKNAELAAADFAESGREYRKRSAKHKLQDSENYLAYANEELRQLQKMYTKDQLVGETEEIVLQRQRDAVARSEFAIELASRTLKGEETRSLPSEAKSIVHKWDRARYDLLVAKNAAPLTLRDHEIAIVKAENELAKGKNTLAQFRSDRKQMTLRSPHAGIAYHGRFSRGTWNRAGVDAFLFPGGKAPAFKTLITVVNPATLKVYGHLPIRVLGDITTGLAGRVVPNGLPDLSLPATVSAVSATPVLQDWWRADIAVELPDQRGPIVPGMTCKARFTHHLVDVLRAPSAGVFDDPTAPDTYYVFVVTDGGEERRVVKRGRVHGDVTVVSEGLKAGDKIRLEHP
jgi:multidrug resistance efflux pump